MNVYENVINRLDVDDVSGTLRQYEESGCNVRKESSSYCGTVVCGNEQVNICDKSNGYSISADHDELDEAPDAFWTEEPC
jgi:hypothetical protein